MVGGTLSTTDSQWQPMIWSKRSGMRFLGAIDDSIYAVANAINDAGQIIGTNFASTSTQAFYSDRNTGLKFLNGLGGDTVFALALSQQGVIVGLARDAASDQFAVMWPTPSSNPTVLPLSAARGINNLGEVVGEAVAAGTR